MDEREKRIRKRLRDDFPHYAEKCLKIRSKSGELKPLVLNEAQLYIHKLIENQKLATGKVRAIILKGRQIGCSTLIEGRFYWLVTHRMGYYAFILTHDKEATNNLFEMTQRYYEYCPSVVRPPVDTSNAKELKFSSIESGYKIGTAGNKTVGRSSTIQLLHGCLAEGSLIYNPVNGGIKKIEDFSIGDYVQTHKLNLAKISYISSQDKYCYKITLRGLTAYPLIATKEHKFLTKDGWKMVDEIKPSDAIGYPIKKINRTIRRMRLPEPNKRAHGGGNQFIAKEFINLDYNFGRILGLYLAEGHLKLQHKTPNYPCSVSFSVHRKELKRTIDWLAAFDDYYSSIKTENRENSLTSIVTIYGSRFSTLINELCGRTTNKHLPLLWHEMGEEFCRGILHGYISGDGHSNGYERRIRAMSICHAITVSMRDLAASLGYGWASIGFKESGIRQGRNEKDAYSFILCGNGASKLAKEIGKPTPEILRKKTTSTKQFAAATTEISDGYAWIRVKSIEDVGVKRVYDFEIDHEDHSYCILHGASHNSEAAFWPNAAEHAKGIMQAVPNEKGTEIILESTANGVGNYFHEQWQLAEAGQSDFMPIFIPWFWGNEYKREITEDFVLTDEEHHLAEFYNISPEQLNWRRYKIAELSVGGLDGHKAFLQEYPSTAAEAFQTSGEDSLITPDIVVRARKCKTDDNHGALIIGVDPARYGNDRTSIIRRRGRKAYGLVSFVKKETMEIVGIVNRIIQDESPSRVCIDIGGLGVGIYDRLVELGYKHILVPVNGGAIPLDGKKYFNKRAEMWGLMKEWMQNQPAEIPDTDSLHADLCGIRYKFDSNTRLQLEKKEDMKKRGVRSPDEADALALTFAVTNFAIDNDGVNKYKDTARELAQSFQAMDRLKKAAYK